MPSHKNLNRAFEKSEFKSLAIDAYITDKISIARTIADTEFTYGYKKVRADGGLTKKFATLTILRGVPTLVLHFGEKIEKEGLRIQKEVDMLLKLTYERNTNQISEKAHEVFIRLDLVKDLEDIKSFIDDAYEKRD